MFHQWAHISNQVNAEKKLSTEARFRLETARAKSEGRSLFGETPLLHRTHMQTRESEGDKHRYELWENMAPRGGRGDGRTASSSSTIAQSPKSHHGSDVDVRRRGDSLQFQQMLASV